jgi:hypothetical protein
LTLANIELQLAKQLDLLDESGEFYYHHEAHIPRHSLLAWMKDRRNRRTIPHRLEACGYKPVRNKAADDELWKVGGSRAVVYAKASLAPGAQLAAVEALVNAAAAKGSKGKAK